MTRFEGLALAYVGLPTIIFVASWTLFPYGLIGGLGFAAAMAGHLLPRRGRWSVGPSAMLLLPIVTIAALWTILSGGGHLVYANPDWVVRDAVLVDLVRDAWPVSYHVDGSELLLRAPLGYYLPAAIVGKLAGLAAAEYALMIWTMLGVALTFALMLRDRPTLRAALIRIMIFVAFSGMDIVGETTHHGSPSLGEHIEWWDFLFQYSSQTTQLFWVPNHALPGWIAIAWLLGQDPKRLSMTTAILFVVFTPLWSPLTAVGLAPIVGVALLQRVFSDSLAVAAKALADWRMWVPVMGCLMLVFPFLLAGSEQVASGSGSSVRFVGDDFMPRYIEFVALEFAGFVALLVSRRPGDPLLWVSIAILLALPFYRFGPANDLAMRGSIAPLTLLAIRMGQWLSTPHVIRLEPRRATIGMFLLSVGAVTPLMEVARVFQKPAWPLDSRSSVVDVTRGTHYLTSPETPWLRRFVKPVDP